MAMRLFHAKGQDGRPAFNFKDLRTLSMMPFDKVGGNEWNIRCFLLNAELLEKLHLHIGVDRNLVELHDDILSSTSRTLKVLDLTV